MGRKRTNIHSRLERQITGFPQGVMNKVKNWSRDRAQGIKPQDRGVYRAEGAKREEKRTGQGRLPGKAKIRNEYSGTSQGSQTKKKTSFLSK